MNSCSTPFINTSTDPSHLDRVGVTSSVETGGGKGGAEGGGPETGVRGRSRTTGTSLTRRDGAGAVGEGTATTTRHPVGRAGRSGRRSSPTGERGRPGAVVEGVCFGGPTYFYLSGVSYGESKVPNRHRPLTPTTPTVSSVPPSTRPLRRVGRARAGGSKSAHSYFWGCHAPQELDLAGPLGRPLLSGPTHRSGERDLPDPGDRKGKDCPEKSVRGGPCQGKRR